MDWIIFLLVAGLILVVVEVFLPSGLFGVAGGLCLLVAIGMTYTSYGIEAGTWLLGAVIMATIVGLVLWVKYFPKTPTGRRMMLSETSANLSPERNYVALLGKRGVVRSQLRPAGVAEIEGQRLDVVTEGGMIEPGATVQVNVVDGTRIVVRKV